MENIIEKIKKEVEEDGTFTIEKYSPSSLLLTFETEGFNVITQITAISDKEAEAKALFKIIEDNKIIEDKYGKDIREN